MPVRMGGTPVRCLEVQFGLKLLNLTSRRSCELRSLDLHPQVACSLRLRL
ncbi:MAG: hypothetical protein ACTS43_01670 [Candidatus Hodgkinia cicadicola]